MKHENFKTFVDAELRQKIYELVANSAFYDLLNGSHHEEVGEEQIESIQGNWVSGWIPRQDGGYKKNTLLRNDLDSTYRITEKQHDHMEALHERMLDEFVRDQGLSSVYDIDDNDVNLMYVLQEYEDEIFEPAILEFRAYVRGRDVNIELGITYSPEEEMIHELQMSIPDFLNTSNEEVLHTLVSQK